jgi:hypothetical protein
VPATYAPKSRGHETRRSGYAAATAFRHARETTTSFATWQATAIPSQRHSTVCR